jgi:hypothetical protein
MLLAVAIGALLLGSLALGAWAASRRFARGVAREALTLWADPQPPLLVDPGRFAALPAPVRRYAALAAAGRERAVASVRLRHGGSFRPRLDGAWLPIRGVQYFAADPPGFVWWGRARIAPGLWVEARDRSQGGVGGMRVAFESALVLADARGPELDQAALLRLLGEMMWFPTALLDERYAAWTAIDAESARATLRVGPTRVEGVFHFGADGLPAAFHADRPRDLGGGRSERTPFTGEPADFREVAGLLVPHRMTASWHVDGRPVPYARFALERIEYDVAAPF